MQEDPDEPSLHFLSTQVQSRYEEHEKQEKTLRRLTRFKNALETVVPAQPKTVKKTRKGPVPRRTSLKSLSAFVREALGSKKQVDSQNVLDFFAGDEAKMNNFLDRLEHKTKVRVRQPAREESKDLLVDEQEWKNLLVGIQLRFPDFSQRNRKSLRYITEKIEQLQHKEKTTSDENELQSMWSQASKQLSDNLTAEDVKWLYDLDEEHLDHTTFDATTQLSQEVPPSLTLSQVFQQTLQRETDADSVISNSECEPEDDFPCLADEVPDSEDELGVEIPVEDVFHSPQGRARTLEAFPDPEDVECAIPSRQNIAVPDSVDVLTSILFAPAFPKGAVPTEGIQVSKITSFTEPSPIAATPALRKQFSPKKYQPLPLTPEKEAWPANLVVTSSPIQDSINSQEVFLTAPPQTPTSPEKNGKRSTMLFHGAVQLSQVDSDITIRTLVPPPKLDVIPDSEDEGELTFIEITRQEMPLSGSVLQVPSSPGLDLPPILHPEENAE